MRKLLLLLIPVLFFACADKQDEKGNYLPKKNSKRILPAHSGRAGELLVVLDEAEWTGELGAAIKEVFAAEIAGLPQIEPYFELIYVKPQAFGKLFRTHRNILMFEPKDTLKRTFRSNVWAEQQELLYFGGADFKAHLDFLKTNGKALRDELRQREMKRIQAGYKKVLEGKIKEDLAKKGYKMLVPADFMLAYADEDSIWMRREIPTGTQGIILALLPYDDSMNLTALDILSLRDSLCAKHVAGEIDGSYMQTEMQYLPEVESFEHQGMFTTSIRGLWRMEGDFMGGPFYTWVMLDEERSQIVFVDAFTFAPKMDKRIPMLQLEAIVSSLKKS